MRTIGIFLGFISIALCENSLSHQERKQGFELLYDGKTLTRWHSIKLQPDAGSWHGRKGILTWVKGGSWLATDDTYYDFVLRLEYRTGPQSNSGVLIRASPQGASGADFPIRATRPGDWNQVEISAIKRQLTATLNGEKVLDVNLDDTKPADGH